MDAIKSTCKRTYLPAFRSSGTRPLSSVKWIVLHSTEGGTAESIARYFHSPSAQGSTHLVVDDKECHRCLNNNVIPWGATGANSQGFHVEQVGFARWSTVIWKSHLNTLKRAAYKTALHAKLFGIPLTFIKADDLKAGRPGITTHAEVSKAFPGSGHWDPGSGWPRLLFMALVRKYAREIGEV